MRRLVPAGALAALLVCVATASAAQRGDDHHGEHGRGPVDYAIIGDTPYGPTGQTGLSAFTGHIQDINRDPTASLVVHLGDIKNGSTRCDTSYFETIKADFALFQDPLVYTPGDNEWTDCHRTNNGGYQPAGPADSADLTPAGPIANGASAGAAGTPAPSRLDEVRRIFFPRPGRTLGHAQRKVEAQRPPYVENVTWREAGAQFGVVNVTGSNNDLLSWFCPNPPGTLCAAETPLLRTLQADEYKQRNAADLKWLERIFQEARDEHAKGVVIGIQADMWDPAITGDPVQNSGFTDFVRELARESVRFRRPVLLLNGDSHVYNSDQPLADPAALDSTIYGVNYAVPNLRRVTVDGSGSTIDGVVQDYLRLHIDAGTPQVFSWTRVPYSVVPGA
jgi:hypothetical protein